MQPVLLAIALIVGKMSEDHKYAYLSQMQFGVRPELGQMQPRMFGLPENIYPHQAAHMPAVMILSQVNSDRIVCL